MGNLGNLPTLFKSVGNLPTFSESVGNLPTHFLLVLQCVGKFPAHIQIFGTHLKFFLGN